VNVTGGPNLTGNGAATSLSTNLTNGTYTFMLATNDKTYGPLYTVSFTVNGSSVSIPVKFSIGTYTVAFAQTGLPSGISWSVSLNGTVQSSMTSAMMFTELNGTYSYTVATVSGFVARPSSGSLTVIGAAVNQSIMFSASVPEMYGIAFLEAGLPTGTSWSVTLDGTVGAANIPTLNFLEPNGTYSFTVNPETGFTSSPSSGSITVNGTAVNETVDFSGTSPTGLAVTFTETGLPSGTSWGLTVDGIQHTSTTMNVTFNEANGTYSYSVGSASGYGPSPSNGTFLVRGAPVSVPVAFEKVYLLIFTETVFPVGTNWSVTLIGSSSAVVLVARLGSGSLTRWSDDASTIRFYASNGTYSYSSYAPGRSNTSGSVSVNGQSPAPVSLGSGPSSSSTSGVPILDYLIIGVVVVVVVIGAVLLLTRRRGKNPPAPVVSPSPPGDDPPPARP
jgi:hypothetical protein